ncbi:hypothetical protein [Paenibacillus terrae]|uniref:ABC transporter, ATPase/permease component n=1 Tax=Paenibacillus terrae TaxID=159743 RepID=A0A0D7WV77_9BACL|nr:hypothetical protein [Paenibacillus terrae]KJD42879.1 ABC transporter, ATPase/permease component [Paenibacillus terrae]
MNNAASALKVAAGLFLTIALITIVVMLFGSAQEGTKQAQTEFAGIQTELTGQAFVGYENTILTGSQVVSSIRRFGNKEEFKIDIKTKKNSGGTSYTKGNIGNTQSITSNEYVNPSGQFKGEVVRDANNVVTGLTFTQQ